MQTIAGVMGNVLEWYDFALFGFFSDIIADEFFPPSSGNSSLIKSFAIFGGAFIMRPIGGLTIGYMGDKYGRKTALTCSLFLMGIPTFAMGCLPTYETAGGWSIFLLILMRMLQGMSVGGQLPASLVYTVEKHPKEEWGFYGSFVMLAANVGTLLGNLVGAIMRSTLTEEQLRSFGWRLPFLSGILISIVGIYVKLYGVEHHPNAGIYDREDSEFQNPIRASFERKNHRSLLACALMPMIWAAGFYVSFVWMAIFMDELLNPPVQGAFWINFVSLLTGLTIMLPVAGHVSDVLGRFTVMAIGICGIAVIGPIMIVLISSGVPVVAFFSQCGLGVILAMIGGPMCAWLCENFSPEVRLTSASMGYDIAHATAGGFSPLVATLLVDRVGVNAAGLIYPLIALMSLTGLFIMRCARSTEVEADDDGGLELPSEAENGNNTLGHEVEKLPEIS